MDIISCNYTLHITSDVLNGIYVRRIGGYWQHTIPNSWQIGIHIFLQSGAFSSNTVRFTLRDPRYVNCLFTSYFQLLSQSPQLQWEDYISQEHTSPMSRLQRYSHSIMPIIISEKFLIKSPLNEMVEYQSSQEFMIRFQRPFSQAIPRVAWMIF